MISSATIPPAMAEGYFNAYQQGWLLYCKTRNASPLVGCAWIDEFSTHVEDIGNQDHAALDYRQIHDRYIEKRVEQLGKQAAKRKAIVIDCSPAMRGNDEHEESGIANKKGVWFKRIAATALDRHEHHHTIDTKTGLTVSFGVVRIANIQPCVQLTRFLLEHDWPEDTEARVMAYHSRQVLLLRHEQEKHLDAVLKRKEKPGEQPQVFNNDQIRSHLDSIASEQTNVKNLLFILVATPVEEVGRDHDFDWAVIEPSSYRSIIQLAGRVKRHRDGEVEHPNIGILQYNWRTLKDGDKPREPRFCRPGYEVAGMLPKVKADGAKAYGAMKSHDLFKVVDEKLINIRLDATPRIQERQKNSKTPMALLEHAAIESQLTHYEGKGPETLQGYIQWYWYLTALPQILNRFRQSTKSVQLYRVTNGSGDAWFTERDVKGEFSYLNTGEFARHDIVYQIATTEFTKVQSARLWLQRDYLQLLQAQSELREISLNKAAILYGEISLDVYPNTSSKAYEYNDQLGLYEQESNHA